MFRLGLRLTLKSGKESLVRLLITSLAIAIGVVVLLGVLADFHAYQKTSNRPSWESTATLQNMPGNTSNVELWNYSENIYKGQFIEQLGVAALGPKAPVLPGIPKLPGAGEYYASPALAQLIQTVPRDELGNRFPGHQVGTIGQAALSFPNELAIMIGYSPNQLSKLSGTAPVDTIATAPQLQGTTNIYREAFGIGIIAILFPLIILINTAARLAAARREERYAAMRLVGATPHQINVIASADATISALIGALLGVALFLLIKPAIADISFSGVKFFANTVTPTAAGYIGMIVLVPLIAALASLISLRRVQISPLGVSRKTTPPSPGIWRLTPLVIGIPLFTTAALSLSNKSKTGPGPLVFIGFFLIMVGLVLSGSWLTMQITKLFARSARNASSLLAARHLSDNPKAAFRSISGLVLAVFVGSVISVLVPAINAAQSPTSDNSLTNVLRVPYNTKGPVDGGLPATDATALVHKLRSYAGTNVIPIYANPSFIAFQQTQFAAGGGQIVKNGPGGPPGQNVTPPNDSVVSCSSITQLSVIGSCAPGVASVTFNSDNLLQGDNPLFIYKALPAVTQASPSTALNLNKLELSGLLVKTNNADTLEKVRTYLTTYNATVSGGGSQDLTAWQMGELEPETVGEVAAIRNNDDTNVGRVIDAVIVLTILTAGCSLAVTVGGSLVERKRPFTLLRLSGTSLATLCRVILLEAALPLLAASVVAAAIGLSIAIPVVKSLLKSVEPTATYPVHPTVGYYLVLAVGLIFSLLLVIATLPLLSRMTDPDNARFE